MLIFLGIVILVISLVIAFVSMIREQREIENRGRIGDRRADFGEGEEKKVTEALAEKPQVHSVDILALRIKELAQEELAQQAPAAMPDLARVVTDPREKQMLAETQASPRPNSVGTSMDKPDSEGQAPLRPNSAGASMGKQDFAGQAPLRSAEQSSEGQAVTEPTEVPKSQVATFGADSRFPNVAGTISVQDLVKRRQHQD